VVLGLPQDQTWSVVAEQGDGAVQDYNTESLVVETPFEVRLRYFIRLLLDIKSALCWRASSFPSQTLTDMLTACRLHPELLIPQVFLQQHQ
jgi:hypothetical protein